MTQTQSVADFVHDQILDHHADHFLGHILTTVRAEHRRVSDGHLMLQTTGVGADRTLRQTRTRIKASDAGFGRGVHQQLLTLVGGW